MSAATVQVDRPALGAVARNPPELLQGPLWLILGFVTLLLLMPSKYVLAPPLGFTPGGLYGVLLFAVWLVLRLFRLVLSRATLIHYAVLLVVIGVFASYVAAASRPLVPEESKGADRALVTLLALCGIVLLTADALVDRAALRRVVSWTTVLLTGVTLLAAAQYLLDRDPLDGLSFPGLAVNVDWETDSRAGLTRVNGTAVHPIEYGATLGMMLPLMLHQARFARSGVWLFRGAAGLAALTMLMTVSRSAVIGLLVGYLVLLPTWPKVWRRVSYAIVIVAIPVVRLLLPGLLGTIGSLFTWFSADPSTQARSNDYEAVGAYFTASPLTGIGEGTWLPDLYRILDNQYLLTLVSQGIVGLAGLVLLLGGGAAVCVVGRRRCDDPELRSLFQSLLAGILVGCVLWSFFDGFSFPQASGALLLLLGLSAATSQVAATERQGGVPDPIRYGPTQLRVGRIAAAAAAALVAVVCLPGMLKGGQYWATWSYQVRPRSAEAGVYGSVRDVEAATSVLARYLESGQARREVRQLGGDANYTVAQQGRQDGSVFPHTENPGAGSLLWIRAVASTPQQASATVRAASRVAAAHLQSAQRAAGAPTSGRITLDPISRPPPALESPRRSRMPIAAGLLAGALGLLAYLVVPRLKRSWSEPVPHIEGST